MQGVCRGLKRAAPSDPLPAFERGGDPAGPQTPTAQSRAGWIEHKAQDNAATFQEACAPFQFGLSTRAGAEAVAHTATELDPSVDGIGASHRCC